MVTLYLNSVSCRNVVCHPNEDLFRLSDQVPFYKVPIFAEKSNVVLMLLESPTVLLVRLFLEDSLFIGKSWLPAVFVD
jgi:hypothetical protein